VEEEVLSVGGIVTLKEGEGERERRLINIHNIHINSPPLTLFSTCCTEREGG
jgi:hypothetical protein